MSVLSLNRVFHRLVLFIGLLLIGLATMAFLMFDQTRKLEQLNRITIQLSKDSSALVMLASEQLVQNSERFEKQLQDASTNLKRTLLKASDLLTAYENDVLLMYLADIRFLLKRNSLYLKKKEGADISRKVFTSVIAKIYALEAEIGLITLEAQNRFKSRSELFVKILAGFIFLTMVMPLLLLVQFKKSLLTALNKVSGSTKQMFEKHFEMEIEATHLQEVNDLVEALNDLRERLLSEMASKSELSYQMALRTQAEQELRTLYEEQKQNHERMLQMEKLSAMGTMVGGVAHELNNPLMGILNYIQYVQGRCKEEKSLKILSRAEEEVARIQRLVTNMLVFSRGQQDVQISAVTLKPLVSEILLLLEGTLKKEQVAVTVDIPEGLQVLVNHDQLKQILVNLIGNARDAVSGQDNPKIDIIWKPEKPSHQYLQIVDNGTGIPEEKKRKIFDPFYTTKPAGKGTGLGLSISKEMAEKMGADLVLGQSEPGHTCFALSLNYVSEGLE